MPKKESRIKIVPTKEFTMLNNRNHVYPKYRQSNRGHTERKSIAGIDVLCNKT
jgi:hypothetical protein